MSVYRFIFFLGFFVLPAYALVISVEESDNVDEIFNAYQISCKHIESVDYACDVFLSRDEFDYTTELHSGSLDVQDQLKRACAYLFAKKKFKQITVTVDETGTGCRILFTMTAYWTFSKVCVSGILFGKERYASLYDMNTGEHFDELKHTHALHKILDFLKSEGYFEAKIQSLFTYDHSTKSVSVELHIVRGKQFTCYAGEVTVICDDRCHDEVTLAHTLRSLYAQKLHDSLYQKNKIERITRQMLSYLEQEGYVQATIHMTEKVCYQTKKITLLYTIAVGLYRQFVFFGNVFFSKKMLLERLMELSKSASLVPAKLLAQEIVQLYKDKGFLHCTVDVNEEKNKCIFLIKEGDRLAIADIEVKNCCAYSSEYLVKKFFRQTLKKTSFDYEVFHKERNDLCDFYIKNGYLDVQLLEYTFVTLSPKKTRLILSLDEGKRYTVGPVAVKGCQGVSDAFQPSQENTYLTNNFIVEQRALVQERCKEATKQEYTARPEIKKNGDSCVTLEWNVRPVYVPKDFGKTIMMGSVNVPFKTILKEHSFSPHQQWDNGLIRSTAASLKSLDVFDTVYLSSHKLKLLNGESEDYVALQLHYDDPYEFRLRGGFEFKNVSYTRFLGEAVGYTLGGSFIVKNIFQKCTLMRCDIDLSRFHYKVETEYRYPWVFGIPLRAVFKGYITKYDQPAFVGSKDTLYTAYNNGLLGGLHRKVGSLDGNLNVGFDWAKTAMKDDGCDAIECFFARARAINFKPSLLDTFVPYFFIEPTLYMDYLDDKMNPSHGLLTVVSCKGMVPLSNAEKPSYFVKLLIEQSFFWPFKKVVGALRIRFGHIFHKDFSRVMPGERFYLGGAESLRGYDRDMAPPLGVYRDSKNRRNVVPRGSKSMINVNTEVRFPVFKQWGGVIFHDIGTLADDFTAHIKKDNLLMSTGFGIRYQTPVGPLRFDIGWKWFRKYSFEKSFGWYLTIGNAF